MFSLSASVHDTEIDEGDRLIAIGSRRLGLHGTSRIRVIGAILLRLLRGVRRRRAEDIRVAHGADLLIEHDHDAGDCDRRVQSAGLVREGQLADRVRGRGEDEVRGDEELVVGGRVDDGAAEVVRIGLVVVEALGLRARIRGGRHGEGGDDRGERDGELQLHAHLYEKW